jgi:hypothetical protein
MHLHSFWWRVINRAFRKAWEPFESFGRVCALVAGMVAVAYIAHIVTQEWGDYMIYWTIAVPVVVWWVWFFWNLIKAPHQIHEEDVAASNSGEKQIPIEKSVSQKFASFIFVVVIVSAFMGLLAAKNWQIAQLKKQFLSDQPKPSIAAKPLPDKIIPRLESPAAPPTIVSTQEIASVEPQKQFETNSPNIEDAEDPAEKAIAKAKSEQAAAKKRNELETQAQVQTEWGKNLSSRNYAIQALYDVMNKEATKHRDGIAKTIGYFQCLPPTIVSGSPDTNVAEIRFQTKTNVNFQIKILNNGSSSKMLRINSDCGFLLLYSSGDQFRWAIHIPNFDDDKAILTDNTHDLIEEGVEILVAGQIDYLSRTNK